MAGAVLIHPDTEFIHDIMRLGAGDLKQCAQCASCTSVCSLSTTEDGFPRKQVLAAQWGLKETLVEDPSPWLCFYCGECSKKCTRSVSPGEIMMALRRYLTTEYDFTGLSRLMYRSAFWEIGILLLVAAVVVMLFTLPASFGFGLLNQSGPAPLDTVMLDKFAPKEIVHLGDTLMAAVLSSFLLINAVRMFRRITRREKIPARYYWSCEVEFLVQAATQIRWRACNDRDATRNWLRHLILVTGYATIFTLVVVFLPWFQVQDNSIHWTSLLGYYSTAVLLVTTLSILVDRLRKRTEMHRHSHLSDWLFPILLFLTALSGILLHVFRVMNRPMETYDIYVAHLAIAVPMLVVEVPFGKWAHLLYRPLAIFVVAGRNKALKRGAHAVA